RPSCNRLLTLNCHLRTVGKIKALPARCQSELMEIIRYPTKSAVFLRDGRLDDAIMAEREDLAIKERYLGAEDMETAGTRLFLAALLARAKQDDEAERLNNEVLTVLLELVGEEHPDTTTAYNNLTQNLRAQGKLHAVRALHDRTLRTRIDTLGET